MVKDVAKVVKGFDWKRVSWPDREYLINMVKDITKSRSVRDTGIPFNDMFPDAGEFALFNDKATKDAYKGSFYDADEMSSHLLSPHPKGRKYWLVWAFNKN